MTPSCKDYHLDLLGAWDYAIHDPDGIMGGKISEEQAGHMDEILSFNLMPAFLLLGPRTYLLEAWVLTYAPRCCVM